MNVDNSESILNSTNSIMTMSPPHSPLDDDDKYARKRVCKACDRCRLKKSKCDGVNPCSRCTQDNSICAFGERKKLRDTVYPKGYVEMLEQQQSKLVNGIHELYKRAIENGGWDGEPLPTTSKGYPLTHDILKHLGLLQLSAPEDEDEGFQEDTDILERLARIKEQKVTLEDESARKREQEKAYKNNAPPTPISATKSEFSPIPSPVHGRFGSHQQFKSEYSPAESPAQGLFGSQQHFEEIAQSYFPASQSITPVDPPGYTFTEEIDQLWGNSNPTPPMDQTPMDMAAEFVRAQQNQIWAQSQADRNTQTGCYEQCHPSLHYTIDSITGPLEPSKLDTTLLNSPDPSWSPIFPYEFSMSPRMSTHGG